MQQKQGWLILGVCSLALIATGATMNAEWNYHGEHGPDHWADDFPVCKCGMQSPIDVPVAQAEFSTLPQLTFEYDAVVDLIVENNGHTIQATVPPNTAYLTVGSGPTLKRYMLLQFHWHTGSEHELDGVDYPMEMHLVHRATDNTLGVVGFLIKPGKEHVELKKIFGKLPPLRQPGAVRRYPYLPTQADHVRVKKLLGGALPSVSLVKVPRFNLKQLLPVLTKSDNIVRTIVESLPPWLAPFIPKPAHLESYRYDGSLTTPPCSEGVSWHLMAYEMQLSRTQITAFRKIFFTKGTGDFPEGNRRPVQPLNNRMIKTDFPHWPFDANKR